MFTIVIAGLITSFIFQVDFKNFQEVISSFFISKEDFKGVQEVNIYGFVGKLNSCWSQCSFGLVDSNCGVVLLKKSGQAEEKLSVRSIRDAITKLN
ncbi:MAG: hypothetical protein QXT97_01945, partial [Candidatus Diapherotrites archaeon]